MAMDDRVIVVGAGPVGLVAASYLAEAGVPSVIVEARSELPKDLRASTFHPPTLDMLDRIGISDRLIERGLIAPLWQFRDRSEGVIATFDLARLEGATAHPYRLQCEQWKLSEELRARADANELLHDAEAVGVRQDESGVTLTVRRPDGVLEEIRGRYLIGADGAHSTIRKSLGIDFEGLTIPEIFLSMSTGFDFAGAFPDLAAISYMTDPDEWVVLLKTPSLWRVLLPTDPSQTEGQIKNPDAMQRRLQAICPNPAGYEIVHATAYKVNQRVATKFVAGRVFLAGDAAHVNNPLGGMGMNAGIHDAVNLAENLAKIWKGEADLDIMGRYERQRRKVALDAVNEQTLRNRALMNERDPEVRRAHHDDLRATVADPERHRAYVMRSSMIQSLIDLKDVA